MERVPSQLRSRIRSKTERLIRLANRADASPPTTDDLDESGPRDLTMAQELTQAKNDLVKDILQGCAEGATLGDIVRDVIQPVLDEAVVSEVARTTLAHALALTEATVTEQRSHPDRTR